MCFVMSMRINKLKTFLRPAAGNGSVEGRLQEGISRNANFCKNVYPEFDEYRIAQLPAIRRVLREATGNKLNIQMIGDVTDNKIVMSDSCWSQSNMISGYSFLVPVPYLHPKDVRQHLMPKLLQKAQRMFDFALNPKVLTRRNKMFNKKHDINGAEKFFVENISNQSVLDSEKLDKLLLDKNYPEKINILQFLRYYLMLEKNEKVAQPIIDKQIEKAEHLKMIGKDYDLSKFNYDEKAQVLNDKLYSVLQKAREAIKDSQKPKVS